MKTKSLAVLVVALLFGGVAAAGTTANWVAPPDASYYPVGTLVSPTGIASGVGSSGGAGLDLALVIDTSGSMSWSSKIATAKTAANALVDALPVDTTSVGIARFASSAYTVLGLTPLNPSKSSVTSAINSLGAGGGTNIGAGVAEGETIINAGHTSGRTKMQVVLSDGVGLYSSQAAAAYTNSGIITHAVGVPGHDAAQMQQVATDGHGIYTSVSDMSDLESLFNGTGGNLVGLDHIDVTLPDGTFLGDYATDGVGNFILNPYALAAGANVFHVHAVGSDGTTADADLTLYGRVPDGTIPAPGALLLGSFGMGLVGWLRRRRTV
jgi:uncharacterized protein YegL